LCFFPHAVLARTTLDIHVDLIKIFILRLQESMALIDFVQVLVVVDHLFILHDGIVFELLLIVFIFAEEEWRIGHSTHL